MRLVIFMGSLCTSGCVRDSDLLDTVLLEEACGTDDYGYDSPSRDAIEALERTNCYRNLMALEPATLDERLDEAAQAHAEYMASYGLTHQEDASNEGFTGEWAWDRAETAGYSCMGCTIGEVAAEGADPAEAVDSWIDSVYHRVPFSQYGWNDAGFGRSGLFTSMTIVSPFPESVDAVTAYPVHGQLEVPVSFNSDYEWPDPDPDRGLVGYPITFTVASSSYDATSATNPFAIELLSASLTGPDGEVEHLVLEPAEDSSLHYAVCLLPTAPLDEDETYEAQVSLAWAGDQQRDVSAVFTTTAGE